MILKIDRAQIHFEIKGEGQAILFIHAGVADSRQWNEEFHHFASQNKVIRYDQRGFGKSEPVAGTFNYLDDLSALIDHLQLEKPLIIIGCSMGGGLALNFTLANPDKVAALILVDSAPAGFKLDIPPPEKFKAVEKAEEEGDLDLVAELETQIWFDGDRDPTLVDQDMRKLAYEMNHLALMHEAKELGEEVRHEEEFELKNLEEINVTMLAVLGANDIPYMHAALDYMAKTIPHLKTQIIDNAAHLPNMDQPMAFQKIIAEFLQEANIT